LALIFWRKNIGEKGVCKMFMKLTTQDPVHDAAVDGPGEEVPCEAVPVHRRACRVFQQPQPDRDASQNLVSKS